MRVEASCSRQEILLQPTTLTEHQEHEARHDAGDLGLTYANGNVCRMVEWAPRSEPVEGQEEEPHFMHRTESLDYGIVLKGEGMSFPGAVADVRADAGASVKRSAGVVQHAFRLHLRLCSPFLYAANRIDGSDANTLRTVELAVPSQPPRVLKAGDVCVQRGTMHAWRNASTLEPARMCFILMAADGVSLLFLVIAAEAVDCAASDGDERRIGHVTCTEAVLDCCRTLRACPAGCCRTLRELNASELTLGKITAPDGTALRGHLPAPPEGSGIADTGDVLKAKRV